MFKSWTKKNKITIVFKLQFHATQVPKMKKSTLMIALVPDDVGKPTVKLEKVAIQDGTCTWENPIFESVKLVKDSKSGKLKEKIYHFAVSTGSSKSGFLGEASLDLADFAAQIEPLTVSLPLKFANSGVTLHVMIQNVEGFTDQRNREDNGNASLRHQLSYCSIDESYNIEDSCRLLPPLRQNSMPARGTFEAIATKTHMRRRSNTDYSLGSASDGSLVDWTNSLEDNLPRLQEPSDNTTENPKKEVSSLKRQAELSELALESLQKLLEKECSRAQNMSRQIFSLREERDMLKTKYEQVKSQQNLCNETKTSKTLQSEIEDTRLQLEAIKEELVCEKELSVNLRLQLQKTQNSNSELLLAVREFEAMLEQKNKEILENTKGQDNTTELNLLKKIADQNSEIDIYHRQCEQLNDHISELTMKYELLKKENLHITLRFKQGQAQQIMLEDENSTYLATIEQLESQVERLEEKIKKQADEFSESLVCITELENQVNDLERELKLQAENIQEDLHAMECAKIEQEERAIQAEETLRKTRHDNTLTSERFRDECRRLSVEMAMKVEENEKMTIKASAESDELRKQNKLLQEKLQKCNEELRMMTNQNELKQELLDQIDSKGKTIEMMSRELENESEQIEDVQRYSNEKLMIEDYALSKGKSTEKVTKMIMQEDKNEDTILGTLLSEVETFNIQHTELKDSLHKEQVEKENMEKHISKLEGKLMQKKAKFSATEKKLKNKEGQTPATHMNLASRDNECTAPLSSTKEHYKKSKSDMHKELDGTNTTVENSGKGGTLGHSAENKVCLAPHKSEGKTCTANEAILFNYDRDCECHTSELLNELAILKERNKYKESELKEMQDRYSDISLKFAEVEGERQQLALALRNLKNGKKN
ncbi:PREDICTED: myosin-11-like [Lupinus angustifolius]|uniref:myosin-11-like n=1 Tax=Lupinus angustifolius TaxID=3871 RepID=UPI00092E2202|nr:PREDICTED: myosin-11-like [Lupinus angustifolius]